MYLIVCAPACVVHSMQMWLSLRCEGACWSEIIQIVARRGKGDTWRVEHLTQDDELELGVDGVCVCVCVSVEDKAECDGWVRPGHLRWRPRLVSPGHTHIQMHTLTNRLYRWPKGLRWHYWDSYETCSSLWVQSLLNGIPRWRYATAQGWLTVW